MIISKDFDSLVALTITHSTLRTREEKSDMEEISSPLIIKKNKLPFSLNSRNLCRRSQAIRSV